MRIRDKMLIEAGYITKAKVKWWGGHDFAYPYLWKENKADIDYKESWSDPRLPKKNKPQKQTLSQQPIRKNHRPRIG